MPHWSCGHLARDGSGRRGTGVKLDEALALPDTERVLPPAGELDAALDAPQR
jgi:hypothetical protein